MFNIGKFYFSKKELFLLLTAVLLFLMMQYNYTVSFFNPFNLLVLTILTFLAKGFFTSVNDTPLFLVFLSAVFLTLYYPLWQIIIFYFLSFFFMKVLRVI
ncbi:hypothetical protein HY468_00995 [Candidatus Roizmanbacteria bacterium]|nr:hypothetical protein [Candidatus Roizmanbacteria bacterium]